ncbi:mandelate racemase/muconate lactonizing enzyme family protein [Rhizobium halophytocola]|uniref:Muconate cycloisomerase n=1 Tax=Rhizobium halophytocola TaxID=735519 RepID=A0ABS4DUL7_9HYPH|nr:enolase C-terminal domain-like protein [Rhizobium halophytocola]MBP1849365.1 muconate cycloisomerase [Rhizobium halophytocola]
MSVTIRSASVFRIRIPLSAPYLISRGALHAFDNIVVRLETDDGISGYGEAVPVSLTEDPADFETLLRDHLVPMVVGQSLDLGNDAFATIEALVDQLLPVAGKDAATVTAIDQALFDIAGHAAGRSVGTLLGADDTRRTLIDYTMGALPVGETAPRALAMIDNGYAGVVVKITCKDFEEDLARVRTVCDALSGHARRPSIRVDANGGFDVDNARRFLDGLRGLPIAFVEQPVAAGDLKGMRACRECGIAIAADESLKLPSDAVALVAEGACDVLNVKVTKAGGIVQSMRVARIAEAAGLPLVIGGGLTYGISRFASQHIAAATTATAGICHQGPGPASQALTGDITTPRLTPRDIAETGGYVVAPKVPGLGFAIDATALDDFRV